MAVVFGFFRLISNCPVLLHPLHECASVGHHLRVCEAGGGRERGFLYKIAFDLLVFLTFSLKIDTFQRRVI